MITIEIDKNILEIPTDASIRESLVTCLFIGKIPIQKYIPGIEVL